MFYCADNGDNTLGISDGTQTWQVEAFQLWHHPDGGTAIRASNDCGSSGGYRWINWVQATDTIWDQCWAPKSPPTLFSWSTDVSLNEAYYSGTITAADAPSMPSGIIVGANLNLTWTKPPNLGKPTAYFFTRCTTLYAPCSPSDPNNIETTTWIASANSQWTLQKNLIVGNSYTCYAVASNTALETCSEGFDVDFSIPPTTPIYTITRPNGDSLKLGNDGYVYTNQGLELRFVITESRSAGGTAGAMKSVQMAAVNTAKNTKYLREDGYQGYKLYLDPSGSDYFALYRSGNGTYAIWSRMGSGSYISWNSVSGRIGYGGGSFLADPNASIEMFWSISPDPPESLIAGNLTAPSVPVVANSYLKGTVFIANVSLPFGRRFY